MKLDNRTTTQNNAYFLFQEFVASEMNNQNISLAKLVAEIKPRPTKESLHVIFKSILEKMYNKNTTTNMSREEMQNCLDVYMEALATVWVNISFPDESKRTLLNYY